MRLSVSAMSWMVTVYLSCRLAISLKIALRIACPPAAPSGLPESLASGAMATTLVRAWYWILKFSRHEVVACSRTPRRRRQR